MRWPKKKAAPVYKTIAEVERDAREKLERECDHKHWTFADHGRRCTCGALMLDFGD